MKLLLTIALFLLTLSLRASQTVYSAPDETGLVGYWKMDDPSPTTIDYSGNGNNGTNVGGATLTNGVIGSALSFNGTSQYVASNTNFNYSTQDFSVLLWVYLPARTTFNSFFSNRQTGAADTGFLLTQDFNTPFRKIRFQLNDQGAGHDFNSGINPIPTNIWTQIGIVVDRANALCKIVFNGSFETNVSISSVSGSIASTSILTIGTDISYQPNLSAYTSGLIDEFRIYNRVLSATEITNLYNFQQKTYLTNGTTPFKP